MAGPVGEHGSLAFMVTLPVGDDLPDVLVPAQFQGGHAPHPRSGRRGHGYACHSLVGLDIPVEVAIARGRTGLRATGP